MSLIPIFMRLSQGDKKPEANWGPIAIIASKQKIDQDQKKTLAIK
jgi:hypothetical protein